MTKKSAKARSASKPKRKVFGWQTVHETDRLARRASRAAVDRDRERRCEELLLKLTEAVKQDAERDAARIDEQEEGQNYDQGKLRLDLIPASMLLDTARALTIGAEKYSSRNWEKGLAWSRVYASLMRHLVYWWNGEPCDEETGLSHLALALARLSFLNEFRTTHPELDDRPATLRLLRLTKEAA